MIEMVVDIAEPEFVFVLRDYTPPALEPVDEPLEGLSLVGTPADASGVTVVSDADEIMMLRAAVLEALNDSR